MKIPTSNIKLQNKLKIIIFKPQFDIYILEIENCFEV